MRRALAIATMTAALFALFVLTHNMTYLKTLTAIVQFERARERSQKREAGASVSGVQGARPGDERAVREETGPA